eukprot:SAG31_NODE_42023_length_273_cov_0.890805_1_plen_22_part_10
MRTSFSRSKVVNAASASSIWKH